jgi:hypothetical protein
MAWRRSFIIGLASLLLIACGAPAPVPTITPTASMAPTATIAPGATSMLASATPRLAVPPPTIAVAVVSTLPPIIVTNPLPSATPWPTATPDAAATAVARSATATIAAATIAVPDTPMAVPTCVATWPTPTIETTSAAIQHFEKGVMFWLQTRDEIWALIASPTPNQFYWRALPNQWREGMADSDPSLKPPANRYQPVRGFGYAWRIGGGSTAAQRPDLGWATDEEVGFTASLVYYPQGFFSPDCVWMPKSGIYELKDNHGKVYRFVGEGAVANVVIP